MTANFPAQTRTGNQLALRWLLLFFVSFFAALWLLDFPKPFVDDLFYCGAGINLAAGGDFSNPLLKRHHFPGHYFFVYPPIHSYAIAAWMKVFGIGAFSLTGFQNLQYLLAALGTLAILRKHQAPPWLEWLVPLGVAAAFLPFGLRPEPLSAALVILGFALVEFRRRSSLAVFLAFLLMFLGSATAPRLVFFSAALVLWSAWQVWRARPAPPFRRLQTLLPIFLALVVTGFLFLVLIQFRVAEFLQLFHFHSKVLLDGATRLGMLRMFLIGILGITQLPVFLLAPVLLVLALPQRNEFCCKIALALLGALLLTVFLRVLGIGSTWYIVLILFLLTAAMTRNSRDGKRYLPILLWSVMIVANSKSLMNIAGILGGKIQPDHAGQFSEASQIKSSAAHPVLVDTSVARYVFNYHIPAGCLDFAFSAPLPGIGPADYYDAQDTYLVSPENVTYLLTCTRLQCPPPTRWFPLGYSRWSFYEHPRSAFIIPAEQCHGLK